MRTLGKQETGRKRNRIVDVVLWAALIVCAAGAVGWWAIEHKDTGRYEQLASEASVAVSEDGEEGGEEGGVDASPIDWEKILSENPDAKAWLRVENTPIDYPVTQSGADDPEYYLHHSFWREWSSEGCPFLDYRCDANGEAMLVYGHHMTDEAQMFTSIYRTYQQDRFNEIGKALWDTPEKGQTVFTPCFAMSVDKTYAPIQTFDFSGDVEAMRSWLSEFASQATARSDDWERQCATAKRALTLVTCSSNWMGQRARTLLVFTDAA